MGHTWKDLKAAYEQENLGALRALLDGGFPLDLDAVPNALEAAAAYASAEAMALVYERGGRPRGSQAWIECFKTSREGQAKIARLRALGVDVPRSLLADYCEDQLNSVGRADHVGRTRAMLELGADIDAQMDWGWTALMTAVLRNDAPWVKMLLEAGADPTLPATRAQHPYSGWGVRKNQAPFDVAQRRLKDVDGVRSVARALTKHLLSEDRTTRLEAHSELLALAGEDFGFSPNDDTLARQPAVSRFESWSEEEVRRSQEIVQLLPARKPPIGRRKS